PARDAGIVLVVEDPGDIIAIERTGAFQGQYHALRALAFPQTGVTPADTTIAALESRAASGAIREIVLALPTDVEGDANASYVRERIRKAAPSVKISTLARGLPADSAIRYSDPLTLRRAIAGRQENA
ncbi:MAG: toprim domain-containing protein, partial [Kiritimatiellae bacterium]|nr:toprim domain-containing protein [Kiritimatiellia bacterium]